MADTHRILAAVQANVRVKDDPAALEALALPYGAFLMLYLLLHVGIWSHRVFTGLLMRGKSLVKHADAILGTELSFFLLRAHKAGWFQVKQKLLALAKPPAPEEALPPPPPAVDQPPLVGAEAVLPAAMGSPAPALASTLAVVAALIPPLLPVARVGRALPPRMSMVDFKQLSPNSKRKRKQAQTRLRVQEHRKKPKPTK